MLGGLFSRGSAAIDYKHVMYLRGMLTAPPLALRPDWRAGSSASQRSAPQWPPLAGVLMFLTCVMGLLAA